MANDFDEFPIYDPVVRQGTPYLSDLWVGIMSTLYQNLISYLSANGIFLPQLTTAQRDALQIPMNGQMIYNTTLDAPQIFQAGTWKTFTTT